MMPHLRHLGPIINNTILNWIYIIAQWMFFPYVRTRLITSHNIVNAGSGFILSSKAHFQESWAILNDINFHYKNYYD